MSWTGLSNNQGVSDNNLQDGVTNGYQLLIAGQSIPADGKLVTKARALQWLSIDTTNSTLAPKSSNQIVTKQDLTKIGATACGSVSNARITNLDIGSNPYTYSSNTYKANKLPVDLGTTSGNVTISVSFDYLSGVSTTGTYPSYSLVVEYHGTTTTFGTSGGYIQSTGSFSFTYNYTYNSSYGSIVYIYITEVL